jgi:PadR family transcriptional regulator PadR
VKPPMDLVRGTVDVLILKSLTWRPLHGYQVASWIAQVTDDELQIEEGTLYPALHRLEHKGMITAEWGLSENNRRAKYYSLTSRGRDVLAERAKTWERYASAVSRVLRSGDVELA